MLVTTSWIEKKYNKFNKLYFDNKLPKNLKFQVNNSKHNWGYAQYRIDWNNNRLIPELIIISNYYDSPEEVKIQTLLHEMIHIKDFMEHPEHFIRNGKKLNARTYDAHGYWFNWEAERISKKSGYKVSNYITKEEVDVSVPAKLNKKNYDRKKNDALICAITGNNNYIWYFKTDKNKVNHLKKNIPSMYNWDLLINGIKNIKFYTFDNPEFASRPSCYNRIIGWKKDKLGFMNKMKEFKATEVKL